MMKLYILVYRNSGEVDDPDDPFLNDVSMLLQILVLSSGESSLPWFLLIIATAF